MKANLEANLNQRKKVGRKNNKMNKVRMMKRVSRGKKILKIVNKFQISLNLRNSTPLVEMLAEIKTQLRATFSQGYAEKMSIKLLQLLDTLSTPKATNLKKLQLKKLRPSEAQMLVLKKTATTNLVEEGRTIGRKTLNMLSMWMPKSRKKIKKMISI